MAFKIHSGRCDMPLYRITLGFALLLVAFIARRAVADDLVAREEMALRAAAARVAPSVVRIETVGGNESTDPGPSTGLVIAPDGHIVTAEIGLRHSPSSILVDLGGGVRLAARRVATDHSRHLVLLKVEPPAPLPVPEASPLAGVRVGHWSVALGRSIAAESPSVSVGVVSALGRIWSRAIQTDAKISPVNYGGPLVDIHGRVMGVLAPLSPSDASVAGGAEWYDSGIGFAVPLVDVLAVLPRWREGKDLLPGVIGIGLRGNDQFGAPAVIGAVRPNSPAYDAGFKADDLLVEAAGQPVTRQAQLKHIVGRLYAGDKLKLVVLRGEERIEREIELVDKLIPYEHPLLGILPRRDGAAGGVTIRHVYPDSPAARAGVSIGETILAVDGVEVASIDALLERMNSLSAGGTATLRLKQGDATRELTVTLGSAASAAELADLPPARAEIVALAAERPAVGKVSLKLPEFAHECPGYIPERYDPSVPHGVIVWFDPLGKYDDVAVAATIARWSPLCDKYDCMLLVPRAADNIRWDAGRDLPYVRKIVDQAVSTYRIDPRRVTAIGGQAGAGLAFLFASQHRDLVRGVALVASAMPAAFPENEPVYRHAFLFAAPEKLPAPIEGSIQRLREMKYPVSHVALPEGAKELDDSGVRAIGRWLDGLDRF